MSIRDAEISVDAGTLPSLFREIGKNVQACMQCGMCTGSCSSAHYMDLTPRQVWRRVQAGLLDEVFHSKTFSLCTSCYFCTLRCPRGLLLTETMGALKRAAQECGLYPDGKSPAFYRAFLKTVRKYGRIREAEMMTRYFAGVRNPFVPLGFTPLAVRLAGKGKIGFQLPGFHGAKLGPLFKKVEELEKRA